MAFGALKGTLVGSANSITNPTNATGSVAVVGGDIVIALIAEQNSLTSSNVTDNLGHKYIAQNAGTDAGSITGRMWITRVTYSGTLTTVSFSATGSTNNVAVVAAVYEGPFDDPWIDSNPTNTTDGTTPFSCPATGTLSQADELVIAWMVTATNATLSATSPLVKDISQVSQSVAQAAIGSKVVASTSTTTPEFTGTSATSAQGTITLKQRTDLTGIQIVGAPQVLGVIGGADATLTFNATLQENDFVVVWGGTGLQNPSISTPGYTSIIGPTNQVQAFYKRMGASPDTSVVGAGSGVGNNDCTIYGYMAFRGVDTSSPFDQTATSAGNGSTGTPDCPSIVTQTNGAVVLAVAVKFFPASVQPTTPTGYTVPTWDDAQDNIVGSIVGCYRKVATAGTEDPSSFSNWTGSGAWEGFSIALKPASAVTAVTGAYTNSDIPPPIHPINLRSWAWNYNLDLIGQDQLPTGAIRTDLTIPPYEYHVQLRTWHGALPPPVPPPVPFAQFDWPLPTPQPLIEHSWAWRYNLNLVGQDQFPPGKVRIELTTKPYEHHVQLRNWTWNYNLNLIGKDRFPAGKITTELAPRGHLQPIDIRTITESFNPSLVGQDKFPAGEVVTDLPPRGPQQPIPILTASYNKNLIGQDRLPTGAIVTELPPRPPLSAIQLRTWIEFVDLALNTPPAPKPFVQSDWPLNTGPKQPTLVFSASYNKNLIGQDRLPVGENIFDLPPQPAKQPISIFTASYNKNLIAQDALPVGETITDIPPQPALSAIQLRNWISFVSLALVTPPGAKPFAQYDWPNSYGPKQPERTWTWAYNTNLIGKDQLPVGARATDLPVRLVPAGLQTWISTVNLSLTTQIAPTPFNQYSWPNARAPQQPIQTFVGFYNRNLIGKDRLPVGKTSTALPTLRPTFADRTWINVLSRTLAIPPLPIPHNQYHWPLSSIWMAPYFDRSFRASPTALVLHPFNPIPPPPDPTPPTNEPFQFIPGIEWQFYDRLRDPGPLGWR